MIYIHFLLGFFGGNFSSISRLTFNILQLISMLKSIFCETDSLIFFKYFTVVRIV